MPIHSRQNQYAGVNAHLHSIFQSDDDWDGFHLGYMVDLSRQLNSLLPANYLTTLERSWQLREYDPDVYTDEEDLYFMCVAVYKSLEDFRQRQATTKIELLSSLNKYDPGRSQYLRKRSDGLRQPINLVEIDFLHETEPLGSLPSYPQQTVGAMAYSINVLTRHPDTQSYTHTTYGFEVDSPIPSIDIPLVYPTTMSVDFGEVYHYTFESLKSYSYFVDYAQLPLRFDTYSPADQERIRRRMAAVAESVKT